VATFLQLPPSPVCHTQHPTSACTQLDELVVDQGTSAFKVLQQMDASCRGRMLLAGVRVLVGWATVVRRNEGWRTSLARQLSACQCLAAKHTCMQYVHAPQPATCSVEQKSIVHSGTLSNMLHPAS